MDYPKIHSYLQTVIQQAFHSEERSGTYAYQFTVLDKTVFLIFKTPYLRVDRKISYRLIHNFKKNTGFDICLDFRWRISYDEDTDRCPYFISDRIDINHTIAYCRLLNRDYFIETLTSDDGRAEYLNPDFDSEELPPPIVQKFMAAFGDNSIFSSSYYSKDGWDQFCDYYTQIYGHPPAAQAKLQVSDAVHETIQSDSQENT